MNSTNASNMQRHPDTIDEMIARVDQEDYDYGIFEFLREGKISKADFITVCRVCQVHDMKSTVCAQRINKFIKNARARNWHMEEADRLGIRVTDASLMHQKPTAAKRASSAASLAVQRQSIDPPAKQSVSPKTAATRSVASKAVATTPAVSRKAAQQTQAKKKAALVGGDSVQAPSGVAAKPAPTSSVAAATVRPVAEQTFSIKRIDAVDSDQEELESVASDDAAEGIEVTPAASSQAQRQSPSKANKSRASNTKRSQRGAKQATTTFWRNRIPSLFGNNPKRFLIPQDDNELRRIIDEARLEEGIIDSDPQYIGLQSQPPAVQAPAGLDTKLSVNHSLVGVDLPGWDYRAFELHTGQTLAAKGFVDYADEKARSLAAYQEDVFCLIGSGRLSKLDQALLLRGIYHSQFAEHITQPNLPVVFELWGQTHQCALSQLPDLIDRVEQHGLTQKNINAQLNGLTSRALTPASSELKSMMTSHGLSQLKAVSDQSNLYAQRVAQLWNYASGSMTFMARQNVRALFGRNTELLRTVRFTTQQDDDYLWGQNGDGRPRTVYPSVIKRHVWEPIKRGDSQDFPPGLSQPQLTQLKRLVKLDAKLGNRVVEQVVCHDPAVLFTLLKGEGLNESSAQHRRSVHQQAAALLPRVDLAREPARARMPGVGSLNPGIVSGAKEVMEDILNQRHNPELLAYPMAPLWVWFLWSEVAVKSEAMALHTPCLLGENEDLREHMVYSMYRDVEVPAHSSLSGSLYMDPESPYIQELSSETRTVPRTRHVNANRVQMQRPVVISGLPRKYDRNQWWSAIADNGVKLIVDLTNDTDNAKVQDPYHKPLKNPKSYDINEISKRRPASHDPLSRLAQPDVAQPNATQPNATQPNAPRSERVVRSAQKDVDFVSEHTNVSELTVEIPRQQYKNKPYRTGRLHFRGWQDKSVITSNQLRELAQRIRTYRDQVCVGEAAQAPILIHCKAGVGRSGVLASCIQVMDVLDTLPESEITAERVLQEVLYAVYTGRRDRGLQFVQTKEQFGLLLCTALKHACSKLSFEA